MDKTGILKKRKTIDDSEDETLDDSAVPKEKREAADHAPQVPKSAPQVRKKKSILKSNNKTSIRRDSNISREVDAKQVPKSAPQVRKKKSILKSNRRATISHSNPTSKDSHQAKNRRVSINPKVMVTKPKKVEVADLFDDDNSLFGCEMLSYAKTPKQLIVKHSDSIARSSRTSKSSTNGTMILAGQRRKNRSSLRAGELARRSRTNTIQTMRVERQSAEAEPQSSPTSVIQRGNKDIADDTQDDLSINNSTGGGSFGDDDDHADTVLHSPTSDTVSFAQPFHDVYFGNESGAHTASLSSGASLDSSVNEDQPFYDSLYGQDGITEEKDESCCQPFRDCLYGLDSNESELDFTSLDVPAIDPPSAYFHDSYFGNEEDPYAIEEEDENDLVPVHKAEKRVAMIRRTVRSNGLIVVLFAVLLTRAVVH